MSERNLFQGGFNLWCSDLRLYLGTRSRSYDGTYSRQCHLWVLQCDEIAVLEVMRTDAAESDIKLSEDELLTNDECAVVVGSHQTIGIIELNAASTFVHVVNNHGDRKELATLMDCLLHVADVADNGVREHD